MLDAWFEDGLLHDRERSEGWGGCSYDQIGIYEVRGVQGEYLIFATIEDPCPADSRLLAATWISSDAR